MTMSSCLRKSARSIVSAGMVSSSVFRFGLRPPAIRLADQATIARPGRSRFSSRGQAVAAVAADCVLALGCEQMKPGALPLPSIPTGRADSRTSAPQRFCDRYQRLPLRLSKISLSQVRERLAVASSKIGPSRISARRSRWRTRRNRSTRRRTDLRLAVCQCNLLAHDFQLKYRASLFFGKRRLDVADRALIAGDDVVLEGVDALLRLALLIQ